MHLREESTCLSLLCLPPELARESDRAVEGREGSSDIAGGLVRRREYRQRVLFARAEARAPVEGAGGVEARERRSWVPLPDVVVRLVRVAVSLELCVAERSGKSPLFAMGIAGAPNVAEVFSDQTEIARGACDHITVVRHACRLDRLLEEPFGLGEVPGVFRDEPEHVVGLRQTFRRCPPARHLDCLVGTRACFVVVAQSIRRETDSRQGTRPPVRIATCLRSLDRCAPDHARAVELVVREEGITGSKQGIESSLPCWCALGRAVTRRTESDARAE